MGLGRLEEKAEVEVEGGKEAQKVEEKEKQDGQEAKKEKKRIVEAAQVLRLITLAAYFAITKAEETEEEAGETFSCRHFDLGHL